MNPPSDLENYLRDYAHDGRTVDTDQSFSLAKEKALEKLAAFQLPFAEAWILKLVQCAVAGGFAGLKVSLAVKVTNFALEGLPGFGLDEIEQAFFDPDYSARRDLCHLVTALRVRGYNEMHPFWLTVPGESRALVWDGESMNSTPLKNGQGSDNALLITFAALPKGESLGVVGLFTEIAGSGKNAELTKVLSDHAFVCPIPLTLDGRRLDALQHDPRHGWGPESQLLMMGFREGALPALRVPPHTWAHTVPRQVTVEVDLQLAAAQLKELRQEQTEYSLGYQFAAHMKRVKSGKNYVWRDTESTSTLHWVLDGVVIQRENLNSWAEFCSAGCYISAAGIATDITGFRLQESEEKQSRTKIAKALLSDALDDTQKLDFEEMDRVINRRERTVGGVMVFVGTVCLVVNPFLGLLIGGAGAYSMYTGSSEAERRRQSVADCAARLKRELGSPSN